MGSNDINIFQVVVIGVFMALGVIAVIVFASIRADSEREARIPIRIWGTIDDRSMDRFLQILRDETGQLRNVTYARYHPSTFYETLVNAMAAGTAPDMIIIEHTEIVPQWDKLIVIPYQNFPEVEYRSTYVEAAELFLSGTGAMAIPFTIDPIVMYWNRDLFFSAGIPNPPKTWEEVNEIVPKLTKLSSDLRVEKSAIAFGQFSNVNNASAILSALFLQAGTPIVTWGRSGLSTVLKDQFNLRVAPGEAALRYYTQFADPARTSYSWSRSMPNSRDAFLAGDLAIYFGYASEATTLSQMNPNINFGIATLPQSSTASRRSTYARMFALAIPRTAPNPTASFVTARQLTTVQAAGYWRSIVGLPSVRRDMLSLDAGSTYWSVVNDSALIARSWLQPGKAAVDDIFQRMVESVTTGRLGVSDAVQQADSELERYVGR